ncbi:probable WRKY transcription factor protein 1 isoform X1 [Episyrphus balteatus]|uniref:probable WRKY transcription factor protein 1 isoform X1 n=1 Tax=Episyrphus balteatus TaxID=286459 RepID=UPI002485154B|nr:probable WRKY transcription factor protein 1 isoform X1 [Episyrphus balteatus]
MAPFKLKFRMGGSRSTSQEVDSDPQVNEALLNHSTTIGASSSTIDSADCTSLGSIGNERKSLLPNKTNNLRLGYLNPTITQCTSESPVPKSPPPSYEHVLEENTRLANSLDLGSRLTLSAEDGCSGRDSAGDQSSNIRKSTSGRTSCEQIENQCTDPDCTENTESNEHISEDAHNNNNQQSQNHCNNVVVQEEEDDDNEPDNRKESIDSTEYLISRMTAPSSEENLLDDCSGSACHSSDNSGFCDPLMHEAHHNQNNQQQDLDCSNHDESQQNQPPPEYSENQENQQSDSESDGGWDSNQMSQMSGNYSQQQERSEIISNKSSKEIYKAISKQWGITCKMSDQCRCMECQSHYFDCEFDDNDHQKTDGGLGAGTPMFISEVMQGSACTIL